MSAIYADMTEEQLIEEIQSLREKIRSSPDTPSVRSVTGEGRRLEFGSATSNIDNLRRLLREATDTLTALQNGGGGSAIGVVF